MGDQPPRIAELLLLKLVGGRDAEVIAGDLRETFANRGGGRVWYWWQVASCILVRLSLHRRLIPDLRRDFHYALRIIRRNPGYAITAMLCLGFGIGVNTTVFSWLDEMYFRRLSVRSRTKSFPSIGLADRRAPGVNTGNWHGSLIH